MKFFKLNRLIFIGLLFFIQNPTGSFALEEISAHHHWNFKEAGMIPIQNGGRIKPFDSFARETILSITERTTFQGWDPVDLILSWVSRPQYWSGQKIVRIDNKEVKRQLLVSEELKYFSVAELMKNPAFMQYANQAGNLLATQEDPKQRANRKKELSGVIYKVQLFNLIVSGQAWTMIPSSDSEHWGSLAEVKTQIPNESTEVLRELSEWIRYYLTDDQKNFEVQSEKLLSLIQSAASQKEPSIGSKIKAEWSYHHYRPFLWTILFYFLASLIWVVSMVKPQNKKLLLSAWSFTWIALLLHSIGFALRVYITGRPPVSNMYESVVWVSFGVLFFALLIYYYQRQRILLVVSCFLAGLFLFAADAAPAILDPSLSPLVPVLRSNFWLTTHVLTITISYAAFALSLGIGNVSLFYYTRASHTKKTFGLNQLMYRAVQFGVVLLAAGTILGGVWADYSWGRFWGWDPKEVWALIALLTYLVILHGRYAGWMHGIGFPIATVCAFLSVVMAWYGVNFVLGVGLHTYGISSGGASGVLGYTLLQLAYIGWVSLCYKKQRL